MINDITVTICTRNRWDELRVTLEHLARIGLSKCPLLIADDASSAPCPVDLSCWDGNVRLLVSEKRIGLIAQRNLLNHQATTPYILSVDDDSYPLGGDFTLALNSLQDRTTAVVGFPVRTADGRWQVAASRNGSQRRFFIGCAHLLKKEAFARVNGYRSALIHQGEELDLSARLFMVGYGCVHVPGPVFEHRLSSVGRSYDRMDFYGTRNELLFIDWYAPKDKWAYRIMRSLTKRSIQLIRDRRAGVPKGVLSWIQVRSELMHFRQRMSKSQWSSFNELPY